MAGTESDLPPRENHLGCCLAFAIMLEKPMVFRDSRDPLAIQEILVGWNRSVPRGINIATSSDDGEIEEVFTSTTVGSRDTVFLLFRGAGMRSATEAKLQEFGDMTRMEPGEPDRPRRALWRPVVESEVRDETAAPVEEVHDGD